MGVEIVMKRVRIGRERASTETWAPSRTLTPQVHIYERRGMSFVQIYYCDTLGVCTVELY